MKQQNAKWILLAPAMGAMAMFLILPLQAQLVS
jgi:hypothetical protein